MDDILRQLFHGDLRESERSVENLQKTKAGKQLDEVYSALLKTLSKTQRELFEAYYSAHASFSFLENERFYTNGVKTGMRLVIASMDFQP